MMRIPFLIFCILPLFASAQLSLGETKQQIHQEIKQKLKEHTNSHHKLTETDSSLVLAITSANKSKVVYSYKFNANGYCSQQKITNDSDKAMQMQMDEILSVKKYNWKKINENQYISDFESGLILEFPPENTEHSLIIIKTEWTKEFYELLLSQ